MLVLVLVLERPREEDIVLVSGRAKRRHWRERERRLVLVAAGACLPVRGIDFRNISITRCPHVKYSTTTLYTMGLCSV